MLGKYPQDYRYYWVTEYPDTVPGGRGYTIVKRRSIPYYLLMTRAKLLITNDMADESLLKRRGQIYISTWHGGGAYKKVAFDVREAGENLKKLNKWYRRLDYLVLSNGFLVEQYKQSFRVQERQMLKTGMPRSDVFYRENGLYRDIRQQYHLNADTKILLYAPTYRTGEYELLSEKELTSVLEMLAGRFGGEWVCFCRMHYFDREHRYAESDKIHNGNDYADAQEFLCATDVLLTDYSSLLWDFTLLKRPCFSYAKDPEKFVREEREFYLPYAEWPYPKAATLNELAEQIGQFDEDNYKKELERYMDRLDNYETGNSTEQVVEVVRRMCSFSDRERE